MNRSNGMGLNWNSLYPFPLYNASSLMPTRVLPPSPAYTFPVIQEPVVPAVPAPVSPWLVIGGGAVLGLLVGSLIT